MLNHGGSDITSYETFFTDINTEGYGIYSAVRYASDLDYVDSNQIGIVGHSMGGNATNISVTLDYMGPNKLISSVYLIASNPTFKDFEGNWANVYGNRSVGLYYTFYDHVYFSTQDDTGKIISAQEFLGSNEAKSFASFGQAQSAFQGDELLPGHTYSTDINGKQVIRRITKANEIHPKPQGGSGAVASVVDFFQETLLPGHTYSTDINGKQVIRRITKANEIHPKPQGGSGAVASVVDFFQETLEAPQYKLGSMQIWKFYSIASILGLAGALAICIFTIAVLTNKFGNSIVSHLF